MTFSISLSPAQETVLARVVDAFNAQRAAETPPLPPVNAQQFIGNRLAQIMATYKNQIEAVNRQAFAQAFQEAPPDTQAQVKSLLGL